MKTKIEVVIGDGTEKPVIENKGGRWVITGQSGQVVKYGRAVWVKTFAPDSREGMPVDGKGFLVGPTRRLIKG